MGGPSRRVTRAEGSWFVALRVERGGRLDVLASNPPYVARDDGLPSEVADWEPDAALYADDQGTADVRILIEGAPGWLAPGGALVLEMAPVQTGVCLSDTSDAADEPLRCPLV